MLSNLRKLFQISQWKPKARERGLMFAIISGPLALLMAVLMVANTARILAHLPKPVDTYKAITEVTRVQNYARNSLLLWMGGSTSAQTALMARSSAAQSIELSKVPFEVRSIDPSDIVRFPGANAVEWQATFAVTFVAPGSNSAQINRFLLTILDKDGNYQMLLWPSIVNPETQPFKVASKYNVPVDSNGALGQALSRFVTAYLTSTGGVTSLGQYVSQPMSAIADSPYSVAEIQEIKASAGSPQSGDAEPGTQLKVLVKVKASASLDTWSIMHLPLHVTLGSNKVWLVDAIDSPVGWGSITKG
ncbi:hypothetical protein [Mycobacteroides abscessus]|uniref:hypothetical protein n=1 Tax=Mycobacteroides abscessus TaxID=36809 RepID=UPI0005DC92F1|nr:hypothetical protein [Mycobacteroides abscessus]CPW72784.1 Uncharacterised protein [Mycobacteroides abscessus]SKF61080.1 Uncharacterised protein [Mycobacteroides abscessus subsp. bolletii]SKH64718.1 Uncharacterised protein [Mycobacteroides abscessus subsp. bolletii]